MNFDIKEVPFSRYGSYISFSWISEKFRSNQRIKEGLYMRTVHGDADTKELFLVELIEKGKSIPFQIVAKPSVLRLEAESGYVEICVAEPKVVRIKGYGLGIKLSSHENSMFNTVFEYRKDQWIINVSNSLLQFIITPLIGHLHMDVPWSGTKCDYIVVDLLPDDNGFFECAIEEFQSGWQERDYKEKFEDCVERVNKEFRTFLDKMPEVPESYSQARELAAYINWSCVVAPEGRLTRPAMLMSKNWMTNVWSWDHCFNAIALSYKYPELAWHQLMVMFDFQNELGALPDSVNDNSIVWNFCKPPIHGWALKKMMKHTDYIDRYKLNEIYYPLSHWTDWWFNYRDYDNDGIPQYNHGNDSGWDNSTVFIERPPIESPDLSAFLIIQLEVLSETASKLGRKKEAEIWKSRAVELLNKLLKHSLRNGKLSAVSSGEHKVIECDSLLLYLPIVLGKRLPENILSRLIAELKEENKFLTKYGFATENVKSINYEADGYWRGPIWAPSTMLIIDGLMDAGEEKFAKEVAKRFAKLASQSGFAENYDALTGEGLRDRAYTWTSSVFLILAHEYLF